MKNKLGEYRYLKEHHSNGSVSYWYFIGLDDCSSEYTYDENGNELTYKNSSGFSRESTYDENGNELTCRNSNGFSWESTYSERGNELTFKNSDGYSSESTYDERGNKLTYKNSDGYSWGCREDSNEDTFKVSDEDLASKTVETDAECWTSTTTTNQPFTYN